MLELLHTLDSENGGSESGEILIDGRRLCEPHRLPSSDYSLGLSEGVVMTGGAVGLVVWTNRKDRKEKEKGY